MRRLFILIFNIFIKMNLPKHIQGLYIVCKILLEIISLGKFLKKIK